MREYSFASLRLARGQSKAPGLLHFRTLPVSAKVACLIPSHWTLEDYGRHTCHDGSHVHFSKSQYDEQLRDGSVELLRYPDRRMGRKAIVRIVRVAHRGLSCSVGSELSIAIVEASYEHATSGWAHAMLAQIRMRRESPSAPEAVARG